MYKCILKLNTIITVVVILFIILTIINGEYLRPQFKHLQLLQPILGSLPNFVGSFVIFIIVLSAFIKKIVAKKGIQNIKYLLLFFGFLIFSFLTIEEYYPFFTGSKTFDIYDIIANLTGVLFAFIFFKFLISKCLKNSIRLS